MQPVSNEFNIAAAATTRRPVGRVKICWTDPYIDTTIVASANDKNRISYPEQVADLNSDTGSPASRTAVKFAHLDGNFRLGGPMRLAPSTLAGARKYQLGWWSANRCNGECKFTVNPLLTVEFAARPVLGLFVAGDTAYNEYPVDFNVFIYNGESVIAIKEVRDNDQLKYTANISALNLFSATKIVLEIITWSTANRVVKITEFYTSAVFTYEGDDIISMSILEEMEITNGSLPVGNISANEMDLKLQNIDDQFCPGNTAATLHTLMKKNRRITAELGFQLPNGSREYVPMGIFWSGDWTISDTEVPVSTSARDRMELLRKMNHTTGTLHQNITLYELAVILLDTAKVTMPDLVYNIDTALSSYVIPWAWFPRQDYMKCLKQITQACLGQAYFDRMGTLQIVVPKFDLSTIEPFEITKDDYFTKSNPSKSDELSNIIEVTTKPLIYAEGSGEGEPGEDVGTSEEATLEAGESQSFTIKYNSSPAVAATGTITCTPAGAVEFVSASYYACEAVITVINSSSAAAQYTVAVKARVLEESGSEVVSARNAASILEYGEQKYEFKDNHLVQTREHAQAIADSLILTYSSLRIDTDIDWRGNPAVELVDPVRAPDYQKNGIDTRGVYYITRQNHTFDGTYRAKSEGRKIVTSIIADAVAHQDTDSAAELYQDTDNSETLYQDQDQ